MSDHQSLLEEARQFIADNVSRWREREVLGLVERLVAALGASDPTAVLRERVERLTQNQCCDIMYAEPDGAKRKDGSDFPEDAPEDEQPAYYEAPIKRDYAGWKAALLRALTEDK